MDSAALLGMQAVISYKEEESLWKAGTLGVESPKALLNAFFYMNGKVLCLRGGHEHKSLKISQFNFGSDQRGDFVVYMENGSKTRRRQVTSIMQIHNLVIVAMSSFCIFIYKSLHPKFCKILIRSSIDNHGM